MVQIDLWKNLRTTVHMHLCSSAILVLEITSECYGTVGNTCSGKSNFVFYELFILQVISMGIGNQFYLFNWAPLPVSNHFCRGYAERPEPPEGLSIIKGLAREEHQAKSPESNACC